MFKSLFTKYVVTFMSLIIVSFAVLAVIITTLFTNYTQYTKAQIIKNTSNSVVDFIAGFPVSRPNIFPSVINARKDDIGGFVSLLPLFTDDIVIFITDSDGEILMYFTTDDEGNIEMSQTIDTSDDNSYFRLSNVPEGAMAEIDTDGDASIKEIKKMDGLFSTEHLTYATPIYSDSVGENNDTLAGAVFVCSSSANMTEMVEIMIKTIIMASLWVMLAALIAVYFISEKIIAPMKNMSSAAKDFSAGKFDVRVPVKGHDEVAELATAFNNMASTLANLEEMRSTFLANVSHDLRTPMTTIAGLVDGFRDGAIPPEKYDHYFDMIGSEVRRLSRLVGTLLDLTRIQAGDRKFTFAPFNICEMARMILISFEQKIDAKKLDVEFVTDRDNMFVMADRDAIYQILYNICDNGIKFSTPGGKYRIKIVEHDKKVFVSVYNEGQGIAEAELPYVFDRFYKSDKSRGLDKTGVGLGLFISKTIIDAHHQEIWVESIFGKYCEFVFTLQPTTPDGEAKS